MYNNPQSICLRLFFVPGTALDNNCFFNELTEAVTLTVQHSGLGKGQKSARDNSYGCDSPKNRQK